MDAFKSLQIGTEVKALDGRQGTVTSIDRARKSVEVIWHSGMVGPGGTATRALSLKAEVMDADTFAMKCVRIG